jgi:hypothetical protein
MSAVSSLMTVALFMIAAIALFAFVEGGLNALLPKPSVEVHLSLNPSTIRENEIAQLTVSLKNLDLKTHQLKLAFDINPRILVYAGTEQLLQDDTFLLTLEASQPSDERIFTMTGVLEAKSSSCDYPISLKVYENGNELSKTWNDITLTIKK